MKIYFNIYIFILFIGVLPFVKNNSLSMIDNQVYNRDNQKDTTSFYYSHFDFVNLIGIDLVTTIPKRKKAKYIQVFKSNGELNSVLFYFKGKKRYIKKVNTGLYSTNLFPQTAPSAIYNDTLMKLNNNEIYLIRKLSNKKGRYIKTELLHWQKTSENSLEYLQFETDKDLDITKKIILDFISNNQPNRNVKFKNLNDKMISETYYSVFNVETKTFEREVQSQFYNKYQNFIWSYFFYLY